MIGRARILALIPARGGSKGLPRKNISPVAGKPLISWTIEAAKASKYIDTIVVSSDDAEILNVSERYEAGCSLLRPAELASDEAEAMNVVLHALQAFPAYDILVLLQPTSPLRSGHDIDAALEKMIEHEAESCVSVTEPDKSPFWFYSVDDNECLKSLFDPTFAKKQRQELPKTYVLNGALYIGRKLWLEQKKCLLDERTLAYQMPKERSVDIDTAFDLKIAEIYLHQRLPK